IQWYRNNNPINGATDTSYLAAVSGTYFVRVSNSNGCGNSLPVIVTVNNNPVKPQVNWSTPLFSTTAGYPHYQWWFNDVMIADSDSNSFRATQTGEYKVTVFDSLGCRSISDSFILRVLAVGDIVIGGSKIRYYPNPVQSVLNIEVSNPYVNKFKAELYDVSGKLVLSQLLNQAHNQLPLQKLPTGFYQLVIHNEVKRVAVKLIVGR
ncbi:MAG TPA: T9SS type A sorting domain-containing protein, partial [Chitinophagaceae bacterium]|nr:T9SS type A sorting domain-containing protein [Chitinophagaceae bacterium]